MRINAKLVGKTLFRPPAAFDIYFESLAQNNPNQLLELVQTPMAPEALSFAVEALATIPANGGLGLLKKMLRHREDIVREGAILGLKKLLSRRTVPGVLKAAIDKEPRESLRDLIVDILNGEDEDPEYDE